MTYFFVHACFITLRLTDGNVVTTATGIFFRSLVAETLYVQNPRRELKIMTEWTAG